MQCDFVFHSKWNVSRRCVFLFSICKINARVRVLCLNGLLMSFYGGFIQCAVSFQRDNDTICLHWSSVHFSFDSRHLKNKITFEKGYPGQWFLIWHRKEAQFRAIKFSKCHCSLQLFDVPSQFILLVVNRNWIYMRVSEHLVSKQCAFSFRVNFIRTLMRANVNSAES